MTAGDKAANAFGGKTARACDSCLRRRARWYCAADDAFLCQGCDTSVHSANQLARRHERVRLDTASSKGGNDNLTTPKFVDNTVSVPAWHHGFTRKARTPRNGNKKSEAERAPKPSPGELVPEISNELDENELEEHLLCRVPEFDPFAADDATAAGNDDHDFIIGGGDDVISDLDINALFLPSELDFAEFAADVESLLGKGMEEFEPAVDIMKVKGEVEEEAALLGDGDAACQFGIAVAAETVGDWGDFGGRLPVLEEEEKKEIEEENCEAEKKLLLQLNYEDVMAAWASQGSPWTTGCRPDIGAGDDWPDCMGTCASDIHHQHPYGDILGLRLLGGGADDKGREARVSRYREKRRTRMFSKKIRYQVRKLNAEKRPRMKGRFVKRTSSSSLL